MRSGGRSWAYSIGLVLLLSVCHCYAASDLFCQSSKALTDATTPTDFCPVIWASNVRSPRGLKVASNGDVLVIERGTSAIIALWDANKNGTSDSDERAVLARTAGLSHGLYIDEPNNWLYASTSTAVFRWNYRVGTRANLGPPIQMIRNIPCCHHTTRSLLGLPDGSLLVQVGSGSNVDQNDLHARIVLFNRSMLHQAAMSTDGIEWDTGIVFARGLRNEVGLALDSEQRVWGVENGVDNLEREDLSPDLSYDNPSEEVNLFTGSPHDFYGYPFCWSEYAIGPPKGEGPGAQWAQPDFMNTGHIEGNDTWCKNEQNVNRPKYNLPAHTAPLDILFYQGSQFPEDYVGDAFVSLHGSWNRIDPIGYAVVRLHFYDGMPVNHTVFLAHKESTPPVGEEPSEPGYWKHRPVGLGVGPCGEYSECLFVSSDASNVIIAVAYVEDSNQQRDSSTASRAKSFFSH